MSRTIFILIATLLFSSCCKKGRTFFELSVEIDNKDTIPYIIQINTNVDTCIYIGKNVEEVYNYKEETTNDRYIDVPFYIFIYNLVDTSLIHLNGTKITHIKHNYLGDKTDTILSKYVHITEHEQYNDKISTYRVMFDIELTDEWATIMHKDYSMLEKFPEYYSK